MTIDKINFHNKISLDDIIHCFLVVLLYFLMYEENNLMIFILNL